MKTLSTIITVLFVTISFISAQDTLYVYKSGAVISKCAVNDLDSMSFTYTPPATGTVTDIDGNLYHWITIGTQKWMVENLKTTKFRTGESISNITDATSWSNATFAAWRDINNNSTNSSKYGRLYNWFAVNDSRKIAPIGWHVPNQTEWQTLVDYTSVNLGASGNVAKALAANTDWLTDTTYSGAIGYDLTKNNSTGFSAIPGGKCDGTYFYFFGSWAYWWISSIRSDNYAQSVHMVYYNSGVYFNNDIITSGFSVRCIKD